MVAFEIGIVVGVLIILLAPFISNPITSNSRAPMLVYAFLFGMVALCLSQGAGKWLVSFPIRWLGRVSYSGYLWHFAILAILMTLNERAGNQPIRNQRPGSRLALFFSFLCYASWYDRRFVRYNVSAC